MKSRPIRAALIAASVIAASLGLVTVTAPPASAHRLSCHEKGHHTHWKRGLLMYSSRKIDSKTQFEWHGGQYVKRHYHKVQVTRPLWESTHWVPCPVHK